jgi:hypothetical protein
MIAARRLGADFEALLSDRRTDRQGEKLSQSARHSAPVSSTELR